MGDNKSFEDYIVHRVNDIILHPKRNWRAYKAKRMSHIQSAGDINAEIEQYFQPRRKRVRQDGYGPNTRQRTSGTNPYRRGVPRIISRRMPMYRKRSYRRRGRRKYRRSSRWGPRVRRAAIKLHESKRHELAVQDVNGDLFANNSKSWNLCEIPVAANTDTGLNLKNKRIGTTIWPRGIAIRWYVRNVSPSAEHYVRIIVGYNKYDRANANVVPFKDRKTEDKVGVNSYLSSFDRHFASIDTKSFRVLKDFRVHLLGLDATESGGATAHGKMWIPLRKYMKYDDESVTDEPSKVNYSPVLFAYAYKKTMHNPVNGLSLARISFNAMTYFKDP